MHIGVLWWRSCFWGWIQQPSSQSTQMGMMRCHTVMMRSVLDWLVFFLAGGEQWKVR